MKKVLFAIVAIAGIACSCTKDLEDRVGVLEQKVTALENAVNANAASIEQLNTAAANSVAISSVVKKDGYYEINFADGTSAKLHESSIVGVKEVDGVLYWTVNGEILQNNGTGARVCDEAPKFKHEDGKWKVSYDGGTVWSDVTIETKEITVKMEETENEYVFTFDDVKIHVAKDNALIVKVTLDEKDGFTGDVLTFDYTVTGADETTKIYVESKGYAYELDKENCKLHVTVPAAADNAEYIVLKAVRNSDGKASAQYITVIRDSRYGTFGGVIIKDVNPYTEW